MEEVKLDVQIREKIGTRKIKDVRRHDFVPAVVYGGDRGPTTIQVDRRPYEKIMRQYKGQSVVFHLNVHQGKERLRDYSAIVKEEQHDPVMDNLVHIDFKRISLNQEIEVKVAIVAKGEAVGVKQDGGSLDQALWELDVVCLPTNIPANIEVDISDLKIGDAIHVSDISLPAGLTTKHDLESILFSVVPPMKEEVEQVVDSDEPEVIGEKKKEEEDSSEEEQDEKKQDS